MVAKNDITGDSIQTKGASSQYRDNYDLIFWKNNTQDILSTEDCVLSALEAEDKLTRYNEETQVVKGLCP
jgi:hypothetical protein